MVWCFFKYTVDEMTIETTETVHATEIEIHIVRGPFM